MTLKLNTILTNETYFQRLQLKHAIPHNWKTIIKQNPGNVSDLLIHDHHLFKGARILTFEKLSSKELYSILITKFTNKPSTNVYFEKIFPNMKLDWRKIYILPRMTTVNTYLRSFQYKILNNILFLNKKLFVFRKKNTPLCSFCNKEEETPLHIFTECTYVIYLSQQLATFFKNNLILPALTPQTALLGLWSDNANHDEPIINHFLLIFKLYVYNSREKHRLSIMDLLTNIKEIKKDRIPFIFQQWKQKKDISK